VLRRTAAAAGAALLLLAPHCCFACRPPAGLRLRVCGPRLLWETCCHDESNAAVHHHTHLWHLPSNNLLAAGSATWSIWRRRPTGGGRPGRRRRRRQRDGAGGMEPDRCLHSCMGDACLACEVVKQLPAATQVAQLAVSNAGLAALVPHASCTSVPACHLPHHPAAVSSTFAGSCGASSGRWLQMSCACCRCACGGKQQCTALTASRPLACC